MLAVYPVLLGTGKRFFAEGTPPRSFDLVSTKAFPSGILFNTYQLAGPLKKGLFRVPKEHPQASAQVARRSQPSAQLGRHWHRLPHALTLSPSRLLRWIWCRQGRSPAFARRETIHPKPTLFLSPRHASPPFAGDPRSFSRCTGDPHP